MRSPLWSGLPRTHNDFKMLVNGDHNTSIVEWMAGFKQELHDVLSACLTLHSKHEAAIGFFYVHFYFEMARRDFTLNWTHNPLCNGNVEESQCILAKNFAGWYAKFGLLDMPEQIFKDFLNEITVELTHATYMEESLCSEGNCPELHFTLRPSGERIVLRQHIPHTFRIHDQSNDVLGCGAVDIAIKPAMELGEKHSNKNILVVAVKRQSTCGRLSVAVVGYSKREPIPHEDDIVDSEGKWIVYIQFSWPGPRQRFYEFSRWHNPDVREFDVQQWKANQIRQLTC